jgi:hypothetical protein
LNRPLFQLLAGLIVFVVLGATSIVVTNALFNVTASTRPAVTFSLPADSPLLPSTSALAEERDVGRLR